MSTHYLVPLTSQVINGQTLTLPKYYSTALVGLTWASTPYGLEPLSLVTTAVFSTALAAENDVYTFPDLSHVMTDEDAAVLETYLNAANIPSDQIIAGLPFVTALVAVVKIFLCAQFVASSTKQVGSLFVSGITLSSASSSSPAISAALPNAQAAPASQVPQASLSLGGVGVGVGSNPAPTPVFSFAGIEASMPVGNVLDTVSQQFTGSISLGGF